MIIILITLLSMIVIGAVLYPVLRSRVGDEKLYSTDDRENSIRMAVDGLSSAQLDLAIGNLDRESYEELEEKYILESGAADLGDRSHQDNG